MVLTNTFRVWRTLCPQSPPLEGTDVLAVQKALIFRGHSTGRANGVYDSDTVKAVKKFQEAQGVLPTGVVDPSLARALCVQCLVDGSGRVFCLQPIVYESVADDTIFSIADKYDRLPQDVQAVNQHITRPNEIPPGTLVCIPRDNLSGIADRMGEGPCELDKERGVLYEFTATSTRSDI